MKKRQKLSATVFLKLIKIFEENEWEIITELNSGVSRFARLCERLSLFEMEKQELILDLTKNFLVIKFEQYLNIFIKLLGNVSESGDSLILQSSKLYICPLFNERGTNGGKSSGFIHYMMNDDKVKLHKIFAGKEVEYIHNFDKLIHTRINSTFKIIIVDDYIGSGDSIKKTIRALQDNFKICPSKIIIISLAGQKVGIKSLQDFGAEVNVFYSLARGISDYYEGDILLKNIELMKKIEEDIRVDKRYKFGYNKSEALISLVRTPNNTFPVFWKEVDEKTKAPFIR